MIGFLGLTGPAGAGKDTVYERLRELGGDRFVRLSVADPLKESVAALFGITLEQLEDLKRDARAFVDIGRVVEHRTAVDDVDVEFEQLVPPLSMRTFLQRYGTESHRGVFGDDFWLDEWERRAQAIHEQRRDAVVVNTSVRFPNEAQRILDLGGEVWDVVGPQDYGAAGHASEAPLPRNLITHVIDNEDRSLYASGEPDFSYLDDQIVSLLDNGPGVEG
jgi:hypothetical protein